MAVPKRRTSRSNTRHQRSQWLASGRANTPALVPVVVDGEQHLVPRHLVRAVQRGLVDPRTGRPGRSTR